jgi:hypothetical protein
MLLFLLHMATAASITDHESVRDTIVAAMNDFPSAPDKFLALLEDDAAWCDPYPDCYHGKANISKFLNSMPAGTDTILLAEPMVTVDNVGGMMTTVSWSWPGAADSCLYTGDIYVSWDLSSSVDPGDKPKLDYTRWVYNASDFDSAIGGCLGPSTRKKGVVNREREADLQAVKDYVVSLQYSRAKEALICDLLVPTARYCDPYPKTCAIGRNGCRAMKGLPTSAPTAAPTHNTVQNPKENELATSQQCRPGSVRPLMPTGPTTGAMYLAYSSASRNALGKVSHKLHHTWAMWDLAPVNASQPHSSQQPPAPMLASFDWFMPNENV